MMSRAIIENVAHLKVGNNMIDFIDKTSEQSGTPINRENMMAVQGFGESNVDIFEDENGNTTITETNGNNHILTVNAIENEDGSITVIETFVGEKTITKTTTINAEGTQISGVLE